MIGGNDGENSLKLKFLIHVFDKKKLTRFNFLFIPLPVKTTDRSFFTYAVLLHIFLNMEKLSIFNIRNFYRPHVGSWPRACAEEISDRPDPNDLAISL